MTLQPDKMVAHYRLVEKIGAGGMGVVWKARDPRLDRDVAIKVLPAGYAGHPDRLRRFEQEARAAGRLNHPNILSVHDVGTHEGAPYVVTELLEGVTLRKLLAARSPSRRDIVSWSADLASGLGAAHSKGIVHRDLKPENIFITSDGRVKILDFGLAKLLERESRSLPDGDADSQISTVLEDSTQAGAVLGTAGYMSPEQARGRPVDSRTDIFALGAVIYEMLTGERAFQGSSAADVISAILSREPAALRQPEAEFDSGLGLIVRRCLEKDAALRFQSASDLEFSIRALSGSGTASGVAAAAAAPAEPWLRGLLPWGVAAVLALLLAGFYLRETPGEPAPKVPMRFDLELHGATHRYLLEGGYGLFPALSPDGRYLAVGGRKEGLRLLPLGGDSPIVIPESGGGRAPFWSPDSRSVAFFASIDGGTGGRFLRRYDLDGGTVSTITKAEWIGFGGGWSATGKIIFAPRYRSPLRIVEAEGGEPSDLVSVDDRHDFFTYANPRFLPDGEHFLFEQWAGFDSRDVRVGSLQSGESSLLLEGVQASTYAPPGFVIYGEGSLLMARRLDPRGYRFAGEAVPLMSLQPGRRSWSLTASETGLLLVETVPVLSGGKTSLHWVRPDRPEPEQIAELDSPSFPEFSPDGSQVLWASRRGDSGETTAIRLMDAATGRRRTVRVVEGPVLSLAISPDGAWIAYGTIAENGRSRISRIRSDGFGEPEGLVTAETRSRLRPLSWSPDGRILLVEEMMLDPSRMDHDLRLLRLSNGALDPFAATEREERDGVFSPDGRWIAYRRQETRGGGDYRLVVEPVPPSGERWEIAPGGRHLRWSSDGREIFFKEGALGYGGGLTVMGVRFDAGESVPRISDPSPRLVLEADTFAGLGRIIHQVAWHIADTPRILVESGEGEGEDRDLQATILVNWPEMLNE